MVGFIFSNFLPAGGWRQASFECTWVEQDMGGNRNFTVLSERNLNFNLKNIFRNTAFHLHFMFFLQISTLFSAF